MIAKIRTLIEDFDTDENGELRIVPIGTVGKIKGFDGWLYDILWTNGAWTRWTIHEILKDAEVLECDPEE